VSEEQADAAPTLVLDVYDILNMCVERPNDVIQADQREIRLSLSGLRAKLKSLVELQRNPPRPVVSRAGTSVARRYPPLAHHDHDRMPKRPRRG
jgi:hypothetical protein